MHRICLAHFAHKWTTCLFLLPPLSFKQTHPSAFWTSVKRDITHMTSKVNSCRKMRKQLAFLPRSEKYNLKKVEISLAISPSQRDGTTCVTDRSLSPWSDVLDLAWGSNRGGRDSFPPFASVGVSFPGTALGRLKDNSVLVAQGLKSLPGFCDARLPPPLPSRCSAHLVKDAVDAAAGQHRLTSELT